MVARMRRSLLAIFLCFCCLPIGWACVDQLQLNGDFIQGGLIHGLVEPPDVRIFLDDIEIVIHADGRFILGFDRDAPGQMKLQIVRSGQQECIRTLQVGKREYAIQRIDGLPPKKVNPATEVLPRIRAEANAIKTARARVDARVDYRSGFQWPVVGPISGVYGSQRILNGEPRRPHYGVDIAMPVGTPVAAPAPGVVTYVNSDMYFSGGTIVLDHGHGLSSSFLHMHEVRVEVGQTVDQGEVIGTVGATGRVTGAHLDWRMNWRGAYIDPQLLVVPAVVKNE